MTFKKSSLWLTTVLLCITSPRTTFAHSALGDMGSFNNGFLHPLTALEHVLLLISISILLLVQRTRTITPFFTLIAGLFLGLEFQLVLPGFTIPVELLVIFTTIIAAFGTLLLKLHVHEVRVMSAISGLLIGLDSDVPFSSFLDFGLFFFGAAVSISAFGAYVLYVSPFLTKDWHWIVIRIISAWIATISLLYGALLLQ